MLLVARVLAAAERPQCLCPPRTTLPASSQLPGAALQRENYSQRGEYSAFLRRSGRSGDVDDTHTGTDFFVVDISISSKEVSDKICIFLP